MATLSGPRSGKASPARWCEMTRLTAPVTSRHSAALDGVSEPHETFDLVPSTPGLAPPISPVAPPATRSTRPPGRDDVAQLALTPGEGGLSGFDLDEDDPLERTTRQAIKDDEVDRRAKKPHILGIESEAGEIRQQLLRHLTGNHRLAPLHRVPAHLPLPAAATECQQRHPDQNSGREPDDQPQHQI